jgi:hypothetical protein
MIDQTQKKIHEGNIELNDEMSLNAEGNERTKKNKIIAH